jgi:hypothetical protein
MNVVRVQMLIDALRSGEYQQTTGCLRDDHGFCCLGVGTDIAIKKGRIGEWKEAGEDDLSLWYFIDNNEKRKQLSLLFL